MFTSTFFCFTVFIVLNKLNECIECKKIQNLKKNLPIREGVRGMLE